MINERRDLVHAERRSRLLRAARVRGLDILIAANPASVCWLSGLVADIGTGPNPFAPASPLLVLASGLTPSLIVSTDTALEMVDPDVEVFRYPGYGLKSVDPVVEFRTALKAIPRGSAYGVESLFLPMAAEERLEESSVVDISETLADLRAIKDVGEIEQLTRALAVADLGHRTGLAVAEPGMTELELFGLIRASIESEVGERLPIWADCLAGQRTAGVEGGPSPRILEAGDVLITDLLPRVGGYWGDTAATSAVGEATPQARRIFHAVLSALNVGLETIKPGVTAGEVDRIVREVVAAQGFSYPHHTGHGIGLTYHEEPRLIPGSLQELREGMVLTVEPGAYTDSIGCRLEVAVVVSADGCHPLSELEKTL
jgi:Xaa-Pro dipeptidase